MTASTRTTTRRLRPPGQALLVPVILAGGQGTRLWPVSRAERPKPFLDLGGDRSLLQDTVMRAARLASDSVIVATNEDYYFQADEEIGELRDVLGGTEFHYLLEPESRDTAPAVRMAARYAEALYGSDAVLLVMPCDHAILDEAAFRGAVRQAATLAQEGRLVTFGANAYRDLNGSGPGAVAAVKTWCSEMFCFTAQAVREVFARCAPEIEDRVEQVWRAARRPRGVERVLRFDARTFAAMPDVSVDDAVMREAGNVAVLDDDFGWRDLGSWDAMAQRLSADAAGNTVDGQAVLIKTRNTHVQSDGRLVAAVGVENLVIVDTPDALLVGSRDEADRIGQVVERLRRDGHEAGVLHRTVHRPWGTYSILGEGENFKVKRLSVKPGAALSLQLHRHRSEHWVVVAGMARVINGDSEFLLHCAGTTVIPAGNRHRLENVGEDELVVIETQTGAYLGEDDIVRFDDRYGRTEIAPTDPPAPPIRSGLTPP